MHDPFRYHPELKGAVKDHLRSNWRDMTTGKLVAELARNGLVVDWFHSDEEREKIRAATLARHDGGDLWVFGYGSLMWDPGLAFTEVRHARVAGLARRFILRDDRGGRGTAEAPGLMAALDWVAPDAPDCEGLAFRIDRACIPEETRILFQREVIAPGYTPEFVTARVGSDQIKVLTFVADHDSHLMDGSLTREQQIRYIATGAGYLGSSYDYICNLAAQLDRLGVHDPDVSDLLTQVEAYRAN